MNWTELQAEHKVWLERMYPGMRPWHAAAGCVEEVGELMQAILKHENARQWGAEPRYKSKDWYAAMQDAIGDCAIYAVSLCNAKGWAIEELVDSYSVELTGKTLIGLVCALMRWALAVVEAQNTSSLQLYIAHLQAIATILQIKFEEAVQTTWQRVRSRSREAVVKPKIVCLCGSTRFTVEMARKSWELAKQGVIALGWNILLDASEQSHGAEAEGIKDQIDELHKRKIDLADEVLVLNVSGYIGDSTRSEIEYAKKLGKPIRYLEAV
jgi:hypothetical protein